MAYNDEMAELVPDFVSPNALQCPDRQCRFFNGARLLFRDDHHLNDGGSRYFLTRLRPQLPF